ncbi:hypothetical protein [Anaerotardibacter muris]|uniref:hypothetical protein n=1 Tax=Anaerotardibacter muris TaxID=2941505 RepID=UPI00203C5DF5|nr:hypothetical protein [Anaerotardibacter muris]
MILHEVGRDAGGFKWVRDQPGQDRRYAVDASKLMRELGWRLEHVDFEAGLRETIAWYAANRAWWKSVKAEVEARYKVWGLQISVKKSKSIRSLKSEAAG